MHSLLTFLFLFVVVCVNAQLPKIENNYLVLDNVISFRTGSNELTDEGKAALKQVKDFMLTKEYVTSLRVEGHSDNAGNEADLQAKTEQRALAVSQWLVTNGIDCKRLIVVGFGSTKPVQSNDTPEGRAGNRRMEFVIAALKGRLVGGMPLDGGGKVAGEPCKTQ